MFSFFLWSWGESNPRPNSLPESFLHAYPMLNPPTAMRWTATKSQSQSLNFRPTVGTILGLSSHWWYSVGSADKKRVGSAEYSFLHQPWARKLSQLTRLIKQRVRSYYFHLIFWALRLTSPHTKLDVLTDLHVLLSKPVNPIVVVSGCKDNAKFKIQSLKLRFFGGNFRNVGFCGSIGASEEKIE